MRPSRATQEAGKAKRSQWSKRASPCGKERSGPYKRRGTSRQTHRPRGRSVGPTGQAGGPGAGVEGCQYFIDAHRVSYIFHSASVALAVSFSGLGDWVTERMRTAASTFVLADRRVSALWPVRVCRAPNHPVSNPIAIEQLQGLRHHVAFEVQQHSVHAPKIPRRGAIDGEALHSSSCRTLNRDDPMWTALPVPST